MVAGENQKSEKKNKIIEAAARVFAQKGFAGAVVADIALQANIGKGTIYEYFKSKEELFFAVFEWYTQKSETAATVSVSALSGSAAQRLEALSDTLMNSWNELKEVYTLVMEFWAASSSSQMRQRFKNAFKQGYAEYRDIVASLIRDGIQRGEFRREVNPESIAAALVGAWDALFLQAWFDDTFDPSKTAKDFSALIIQGLRT